MKDDKHDRKHDEDPGMGSRGVTRPAMKTSNESNQHDKEKMEMSMDDRRHMLHMHHKQTLWIYWTLIILGCWLILSPLTFSYGIGTVQPAGGRELWLSMEQRIGYMKWSDIFSGIALIVFGWRSLSPNRPLSRWIACFIGVWITIAPLLFWAPTAVAYLNDTLVGMLVISLLY